MLLPLSGFVCVWFCSGAAEFHNQKTKTTFSPHESSAAERNVQGHGWLTVIGNDSGGPRGAGPQISELKSVTLAPAERFGPQTPRPCVRKTDAQSRAQRVRRKLVNKAGEQRSTPHGPLCTLEWKAKRGPNPVRTERSEPLPVGAAPAAMAQGQEAEPPTGLNISDYGEEEQDYEVPDYPDPTPLLPLDSRTRRKLLKNPFYPLSAEAMGAYAVLMVSAVIFIVGVIGNVSVMCIVCHNFYMRSISNSLLASLALWDFSVIFFCLPLVLFHQLTKTWLLGELSCKIIPYLEVTSLGVTTFTLCALCIDRFRAATNVQMYYEMIENWVSTSAKLGVIWVGAMLLALPELLIRQLVTEDSGPPNVSLCERCVVRISTDLPDTLYVLGLTYDSARLWWYFGCYFCLPTLFTICSSLFTARKIRGAKRARVRASKKQNQLESQMNCVVVALAILYGFCIVPENICNIVGTYMAASVPQRTLDVLHVVSQLLLFCKSAAAPVLLFSLCQPFSQAFLNCCCCCCEECNPPPASDDHLEMLPPSADQREASDSATHAIVGTHC